MHFSTGYLFCPSDACSVKDKHSSCSSHAAAPLQCSSAMHLTGNTSCDMAAFLAQRWRPTYFAMDMLALWFLAIVKNFTDSLDLQTKQPKRAVFMRIAGFVDVWLGGGGRVSEDACDCCQLSCCVASYK